ncbi:MAG TPA: transposase [Thermoflexales bacterium]|nr:transposase [Thermoflexales bacterium]HRA53710.1 transposase [Thermoflexales bacterium]
MAFDPRRHHRRSIRLRNYDYAQAGAYFVTLCEHERECLFGEISLGGPMQYSMAGEIVAEQWLWLEEHFVQVELDAWQVMPNHFHGILLLMDRDTLGVRRKPLGQLIGAFKTTSAKRINQLRGTPGAPVWQRDFFEHVIRGPHSLERIRRYIELNPSRWANDRMNPHRRRRQ